MLNDGISDRARKDRTIAFPSSVDITLETAEAELMDLSLFSAKHCAMIAALRIFNQSLLKYVGLHVCSSST